MSLLEPAVVSVGYSDRYDPDTHFDRLYTDATAEAIAPTVRRGDRVLELGCATGRMTERFCARGADVVGVDHAADYLDRAAARCPNASFIRADIESWLAEAADAGGPVFDHVIATNVVHELRDLDAVLASCRRLVARDGVLHLTLQNPKSIHRLTGRALGLITDLAEVTDAGRDLLTLRIHDADDLRDALDRAGFVVTEQRGVMVKPFPNDQMEALTEAQIRGLIAVAREFPEHSAMNHLIARAT